MMQPSALRYFLEVARAGSVSTAAGRLQVAASAVSRQIAKLEADLDTDLFERRARGMVLTHAGRLLASYAQRAALESDQIIHEIRQLKDSVGGMIRLGVTEGFAVGFIPELIHAFRQERPNVSFNVEVSTAAEISRRVREGDVDIGIAFSLSPEGSIAIRWQGATPSYAIAGASHPLIGREKVSIDELFKYPVAILDKSATIRKMLDLYCVTKGISFEPVISSSNTTCVLNCCRLGNAITFSAYLSVRHAVRDGQVAIVPFEEARFLERNLQVQTMRGRILPQTLQDFLDFLIDELESPAARYAG